jgi:hypothetical protein
MDEPGLFGPHGEVLTGIRDELGSDAGAVIVNDTDLPDGVIEDAVMDYFVENASLAGVQPNTFQTYSSNQGSLLARSKFTTPTSVIGEIELARDLAERDDDVAAVIGSMLAIAFSEGMDNFHADEATVAIFNRICEEAGMDHVVQEFYREWLISGQINSATLFTRKNLEYMPAGAKRPVENSVAMPLCGVLPAEKIRVLGNDLFGTAELAYNPAGEPKLQEWLEAYFDSKVSPARKAQLGKEDRIAANLFLEKKAIEWDYRDDEAGRFSGNLYVLNPRMVQRSTMPKGSWKYPRPPLTRDFALLEAKRLLNIMDFALLQGGSNFIVVAKKGSDNKPATKPEIRNLSSMVRHASRTGVIVGDHRLSFEIITPELKELLNPQKRRLIGRKLAMALMRTPEQGTEEPGTEGAKLETEIFGRVVTLDRRDIKRHIENNIYPEVVKRNPSLLKERASLWFPKVVLTAGQFFTDYVLKLRDRGDIPRSWATSVAGFPWDAAVQERKREIERGDDDVMTPTGVPFSSDEAGPQDNNEGRPKGAKDNEGGDPAKPKRTISQNPGETVKAERVTAFYDDELAKVVRIGERALALLEEHPDYEIGRMTKAEHAAAGAADAHQNGSVFFAPVNPTFEVSDAKVVRLTDGLSMIVGRLRGSGAMVAKTLCFREPEYGRAEAEDLALRWGFAVEIEQPA